MLLFTEGFDWSTAIADYTTFNKWFDRGTGFIANVTASLRFGSGSGNYWNSTNRTHFLRKAFGSNLASGVIGLAARWDTSVNYKGNVIVFFDTTANVQMGLQINTDGTFSIYRTSNSNILGTSTFAVTGNAWHYLELVWKISDSLSAHELELFVDDVSVLAIAAASDSKNTANAYATHFAIGGDTPTAGSTGSGIFYFDDLYALDSSGSYNNARLGPVRITTLFPDGNGNSSQLVGSDGNSTNNSLLVDETAPNSDTDYVESATVGNKDTYSFSDLPATTNTVYAVVPQSICKKSDAGARSFNSVIRSGGTDYDNTGTALNASYLLYQDIKETNPASSSPFSVSEVNAMEVGFKVNA